MSVKLPHRHAKMRCSRCTGSPAELCRAGSRGKRLGIGPHWPGSCAAGSRVPPPRTPGPYGGNVTAHRYQITLAGVLGEVGREAFGDFKIESDDSTTVLTGYLDQAALYGALNR